MTNVIPLNNITRLDIPADRVLQGAMDEGLETAIVVGWDQDGELYFSSTTADGGNVLWLFELAKKGLLEDAE